MDIPENQTSIVEKRLGEVALVVENLQTMIDFYREAVQLKLMRQTERMAFLEIAPGFAGHTSVLALFKRDREADGKKGTLDHIAFSIALKDYESERVRLEALGLTVTAKQHNWVQWRSLYVNDPEGNEVELVCKDPSIPFNYDS